MTMVRPIPAPIQTEAETEVDRLVTYDARELIGEGVEARIVLDGQCYRLRITRAGKLILTK